MKDLPQTAADLEAYVAARIEEALDKAYESSPFRRDLKHVSDYYRRRLKYIYRLATMPASDPEFRRAQIARNCLEILRNREEGVRLYIDFGDDGGKA